MLEGKAISGRGLFALAVVSASAALLFAAAGSADGGGKRGACANAAEPGIQVSVGHLKKAIHCLINEERSSAGRPELDRNRKLAKVAGQHIEKMVQTDCLDHVCPGEPSLERRIRKSGYFSGARDFDYGEDVGCRLSAASMIEHWMASPLHRKNILKRKFDHVGVAADHRRVESICAPDHVTFVVVFGHRVG